MLHRLALFFSVLNCLVLVVRSDDNTPTTRHPVTKAPRGLEIKQLDWDVWCKLQPNGNDCTGKGVKSTRYYFDTVLGDCKTFFYGSCKSSYNNFNTITECHEICRESGLHPIRGNYSEKVFCRLQPDFGGCFEYHPMFYFDINTRKCKGFSYSGCGGNGNRFPSSQLCTNICLKSMEGELDV